MVFSSPPGFVWLSTKTLRVLKIMAVFLIGCFMQVSASYSQSVTLKVKNAPLKEVLAAVKKQTGYAIFYNAELLADARPVTLDVQNATLSEVLKAAFNGQSLNYVIENKTIFISRSAPAPSGSSKGATELLSFDPVKIRVTNADGQPLAGATVAFRKAKKSGVTDAQGYITLNVEADDIVTISYVGFATQEIQLGDKTQLTVVLQPKASDNEEVVVMAYGQRKKKKDVVGSVFQINADKIANMPAVRLDALLEGQMPGVRVTLNNDDARSTKERMNVRVRGTGSFSASNEPLWIIDGTPVYTGDNTNLIPGISPGVTPLSYINPEDIESITILKDAAAAAIYGANASNGVILVTTKAGIKGAGRWGFSIQNGFSRINESTKFKTLNGSEFMELAKESYLNAGKDMSTFPFNDNDKNKYSTTNTNWVDEFYGTGIVNNVNLSFRGGTNKLEYMASGGYYKNKSTIKGNTQERASFMANLKYKINDKLKIGLISRYSNNTNNNFNPSQDYIEFLPIYSIYNEDGSYRLWNKRIDGTDGNGDPKYINQKFFNSIAEREQNDDRQKSNALNNNLMVEYQILKHLKSTTQYGIDYQEIRQNVYKARTNWSGMDLAGVPTGDAERRYSRSIVNTFVERLNYGRTFGLHYVGGIAGLELSSTRGKTRGIYGYGFADDDHRDVDYAATISSRDSNRSEVKSASYFAQLEYNYDSRYFFQVTGRRDGSSSFGTGARWGNFKSIGVGWDIKNEFFKDADKLDFLRVDVTYGNTGNSRISVQDSYGLIKYVSDYNYENNPGARLSQIPNPRLRWESAYQTNLKLYVGILDRLSLLVEAYRKRTEDAIVSIPVSRSTGETNADANTGELQNQGIEATFKWDVIKNKRKGIFWTVEFNAAHNENTALKLYSENQKTFGNFIWKEGEDINTFYLIRWAGVDPRDGAPLWYDANGNITRVYNINNRVPWKSSSPDVFGGVRSTLTYKAVTMSALFSYTIGGYQFSSFARNINSDGLNIGEDNQSVNQLDRWQQPGDVALNPKPIWGVSTSSTMNSTRFVYKTTNLRLTNLALGYKLPKKTVEKFHLREANIALIGNELFLWTPYDKNNRNSFKQTRGGYPLESSYLLAINVIF